MTARKHPIWRFFYVLLALLVCFVGYRMVLNYIGYCLEKGRVLTEQEKLAPVLKWIAVTHPVDVDPPKNPPEDSEIHYDSIEDFVRDNLDCCRVVKEFHSRELNWVRLGFWERACGFVSDYVSVKYYVRYRKKDGTVWKRFVQGGYALTACGTIVDLI